MTWVLPARAQLGGAQPTCCDYQGLAPHLENVEHGGGICLSVIPAKAQMYRLYTKAEKAKACF